MLDLAPHNPNGLMLRSPVIIAPGCADAGTWRNPDVNLVGAICTSFAGLHSSPTRMSRLGRVPAGIVFERLPQVRLRTLIQKEAKRWARSPVPVLLGLRGAAHELVEMAAELEFVEGIAGLLLDVVESNVGRTVADVRSQTPLPIVLLLPHAADLAAVANDAANAGADALVACAYPPGVAVADHDLISGIIVGPTLAPVTLRSIQAVVDAVDVPVIALGGVADERIAQECLLTGASAVLIDGPLYGDPSAPHRIAAGLQRSAASDVANA